MNALATQEECEAQQIAQPQAFTFAKTNFERKETKYFLTRAQYNALISRIGTKLENDEYSRSVVSSLYYDTPDRAIINRSLEKPRYKEKLRIRMYDNAKMGEPVYVELKKKFKGIVYKRRVAMSLPAAYAFMDGASYHDAIERFPLLNPEKQLEAYSFKSEQIASEIAYTRDRYHNLRPSMMIITNRLALRTNDGSNVRITFDIDPVWRDRELGFGYGFDGNLLYPDRRIIMEVKGLKAYPLWLVQAFTECNIFPTSSSKYGKAYQTANPTQPPAAIQYA